MRKNRPSSCWGCPARLWPGRLPLLQRAQGGDAGAVKRLRGELPRLAGLVDKPIEYLRGVPAETARFTKDVELLRQVKEKVAEQEADARELMRVLEALFHA